LSAVLFVAYQRDAKRAAREQYVEKARSLVLTAESTREEMAKQWQMGMYSTHQLRQWSEAGELDKVLAAVPVVMAWRAAMAKSKEGGYVFKVPKFQPRNPANEPDEIEAKVLRMFESGSVAEHVEFDPARNAIRYFRPIRLTEDCLACHGNPSEAATLWGRTDGTDPTGRLMEGWKAGEVHGAFEVIQTLDEADAKVAATIKSGLLLVAGVLLVAGAIILFGVPALIDRDLVRPVARLVASLRDGAGRVLAMSEQVAGSAMSLSQGATEQAATLEETSASMEEMASMTRRNADSAQQATVLVDGMAQTVAGSSAALADMVNSMTALRESNERVAKIIKTIDEIAFQTNILALNAAVEAARAGESGMGFAVVADEVRNLAQRSAQAARDTAALIEESIGRSRQGTEKVTRVAELMAGMTAGMGDVRAIVGHVHEASRQQTEGINQVAQAVTQMEQVTQVTAATAEESAAASEELQTHAAASMEVVRSLGAVVGIAPASSKASAPAAASGRPAKATTRPRPALVAARAEAEPLAGTGTFGRF